jgi:tetratricopeptide (TPR) repeat protein
MTFRKKTLEDILDLKSKSSPGNDYDDSDIFIDILCGKPISNILKQSKYSTKRSFDTAIYQKNFFDVFNSKIIYPLHGNKTAQNLLDSNNIEIEGNKWKKTSNLSSIIDSLGFRIYSSGIEQNIYNIFQDLDSYQYKSIVNFVEISSSSILKRIKNIDKPDNFNKKDKEEIDYWKKEVGKSLKDLDMLVKLEKHGDRSFENTQAIIKVLERLIEISCDKKMVYCLPHILRRIATCYYHIGAYVDCIAMFDFATEIAKQSEDSKRQNHIASTWIASSIREILCSHTDYFVENIEKFEVIYQLVKNFNRRAFEDHQYSSEVKIEPMWNLCYLELSLISTYHKTGVHNSTARINAACDRLYELIGNIKRKNTNFSGDIKDDIIKDLNEISNNIRRKTNMSNDFISLCEQLRTL